MIENPTELLWPRPQEVAAGGEACRLPARPVIAGPPGGRAESAAAMLRGALEWGGLKPRPGDGGSDGPGFRLALLDGAVAGVGPGGPEAYRLAVGADGVILEAAGEEGLFRAAATLGQWLRIHRRDLRRRVLPALRVRDWPDFEHRGFLLDVSRNKVPTLATLRSLIDRLAELKINQLQLYMEHTFAYRGHAAAWRGASPLHGHQIRHLDAYCRQRFIELVPNQNSFGHFHRWLIHEPYRPLAECPEGFDHPFSPEPEPFSLCPLDPGSLELLRDLYDQLLPNFTSRLFNVGLDEAFDLGAGRSADLCRRRGKERVYLDFLRRVHGLVGERGRRMLFWGDIILRRPELIAELPDDAVALEWGYEADHPFAEDCRRFAESGIEFWVCPGTSAWNSFAGRVDNAVANLASAAVHGREQGAAGYLITDWGDHGHLQPLPVTYPGLVAGSGFAWNAATARAAASGSAGRPDLARLLDLHVFHDRSRVAGGVTTGLGDAYLESGAAEAQNGSALFFLLMFADKPVAERRCQGMTARHLEATLDYLDRVTAPLAEARVAAPGAGPVRFELEWAADLLRTCCRLGRAWHDHGFGRPLGGLPAAIRRRLADELEDLVDRLPTVWLARNRPGGLDGSAARLLRQRDLLL